MTREDAKQAILKALKDDESSIKNCIHLLTLHCYLDKIFDEHGEQLQNKDDEIELLKHRIEEAMKPKTCLGCLHCNKAYQLASRPPQYKLNCGVFKTVFVNDFKQYCSSYEPKKK